MKDIVDNNLEGDIMPSTIPPKPDICDLCLEKKNIMMWDEDGEQWVCIDCMNDLVEERKELDTGYSRLFGSDDVA